MAAEYVITELRNNKLTSSWLKVGIASLGFAGLYSIILVILRTPQLSVFFSNTQIFKSALIIHVNLSVLIWLLSITASIWSYALKPSFFNRIYPKLAFTATILIIISPLLGSVLESKPIMNNYIPMLENIMFILGLSLFGITLLIFSINALYFLKCQALGNLINDTILSTSLMFVLCFCCFIFSYLQLQDIIPITPMDIEFYYELLFWSGGHLLQFIYTQILMFIWFILFESLVGKNLKYKKFYIFLLYLNFTFSVVILFGHTFYDIIDGSFKEFYTNHMKYFGGLAPIIYLMTLIEEILSFPQKHESTNILTVRATIICSALLFLSGGLVALKIYGVNVVIPAHYHGSIVGISIACMGYCYICSKIESLHNDRVMSITLYILTFGQILHISGLTLAGGYGVMRKDPGIIMPLSAKLFMGMMGSGGLIAIVGGLMFVVICGRNIFFKINQPIIKLYD